MLRKRKIASTSKLLFSPVSLRKLEKYLEKTWNISEKVVSGFFSAKVGEGGGGVLFEFAEVRNPGVIEGGRSHELSG